MSLLAAAAILITTPPAPDILDVVQKNLNDATFVARVKVGSASKLRKINDDFVNSYRVKESQIRIKEPFMIRVDAKVDGSTDASYIMNGAIRVFKVPRAKISVRQDLAKKPGQRQTVLDFGILTPALFKDLFVAKFIRTDRENGHHVFDLEYRPGLDDAARFRIWVDPVRKYTSKREWYNRKERQLATFFYTEPKQVGGVWLPTRCTVRNGDNEVAGETWYEEMAANTGIDNSVFATK